MREGSTGVRDARGSELSMGEMVELRGRPMAVACAGEEPGTVVLNDLRSGRSETARGEDVARIRPRDSLRGTRVVPPGGTRDGRLI